MILPLKNRNYFNLKQPPGDTWVGTGDFVVGVGGQACMKVADSKGHAIFPDGYVGFMHLVRAYTRTLSRKQLKHKCNTVSKIIGHYAPSSDNNNVVDYLEFLRSRSIPIVEIVEFFRPDGGIWSDQETLLKGLMKSMAEYETFAAFRLPYDTTMGLTLYERDFVL